MAKARMVEGPTWADVRYWMDYYEEEYGATVYFRVSYSQPPIGTGCWQYELWSKAATADGRDVRLGLTYSFPIGNAKTITGAFLLLLVRCDETLEREMQVLVAAQRAAEAAANAARRS